MTELSPPAASLQATLQDLYRKVQSLESSRLALTPLPIARGLPPATDAFADRMLVAATAAGFTRTQFTRCPEDYYDRPLEWRRAFLHGASPHHLTKSIVLGNTRHTAEGNNAEDPLRSRYLCCVVPYTAKIDSDALRDAVRRQFAVRGETAPGVRQFNYRLAENCLELTGYEPNGVTPLGLKTAMPVVLARQIAELDPQTFWLGGGEVSLKWRVERDEFVKAFNPVVLDFATSEEA